jgi:hypothetical protein
MMVNCNCVSRNEVSCFERRSVKSWKYTAFGRGSKNSRSFLNCGYLKMYVTAWIRHSRLSVSCVILAAIDSRASNSVKYSSIMFVRDTCTRNFCPNCSWRRLSANDDISKGYVFASRVSTFIYALGGNNITHYNLTQIMDQA